MKHSNQLSKMTRKHSYHTKIKRKEQKNVNNKKKNINQKAEPNTRGITIFFFWLLHLHLSFFLACIFLCCNNSALSIPLWSFSFVIHEAINHKRYQNAITLYIDHYSDNVCVFWIYDQYFDLFIYHPAKKCNVILLPTPVHPNNKHALI